MSVRTFVNTPIWCPCSLYCHEQQKVFNYHVIIRTMHVEKIFVISSYPWGGYNFELDSYSYFPHTHTHSIWKQVPARYQVMIYPTPKMTDISVLNSPACGFVTLTEISSHIYLYHNGIQIVNPPLYTEYALGWATFQLCINLALYQYTKKSRHQCHQIFQAHSLDQQYFVFLCYRSVRVWIWTTCLFTCGWECGWQLSVQCLSPLKAVF